MSNKKLKIKVNIANRIYPIMVSKEIEEQGMRIAAKKINLLVSDFEQNYDVNDKQDVLAMCALQFASKMEIEQLIKKNENHLAEEKLQKLSAKISKHLE